VEGCKKIHTIYACPGAIDEGEYETHCEKGLKKGAKAKKM
jgi:hypothetical protein